MGGLLLKGGCVLTLDKRPGNLPRADVLVDDGRIAAVGTGLRSRDAEAIDATDCVVMPGFVDTHRHVGRSLYRHRGGDVAAAPQHHTPDDVYAATLLGLLSAAETGITTVVDWSEVPDDAYAAATLQAHADAGLRTVFVRELPPAAADAEAVVAHLADTAMGRPLTAVAVGSPIRPVATSTGSRACGPRPGHGRCASTPTPEPIPQTAGRSRSWRAGAC